MRTLKLAGLALACTALIGCGTLQVDTSGWPSPATLQAYEPYEQIAYNLACAFKGCTAQDDKLYNDAYTALDHFITGPYTEAYNTGNVTKALLDHEKELLKALKKVISDIWAK